MHTHTRPTPRLKPVCFRSCLMTRAWSMCSHVLLPLCALPGRQRSTAGGAVLGPCRVLPRLNKSQRRNYASDVPPVFSPRGQSRTSKVSLVLWAMVAMQGEQDRCGPQVHGSALCWRCTDILRSFQASWMFQSQSLFFTKAPKFFCCWESSYGAKRRHFWRGHGFPVSW